jgi:pyruvate dehydrogenase E1 component alpha subunit
LGGWRFHTQCLLHGVPPEKLKAAIMSGHSMRLTFPEHRIYCSSIVGGILPIAVGIAMGIKRRGGTELVHVWSGDMTAEGGQFHECRKFSAWNDLPIRFIIEDNALSVCTDTVSAWGGRQIWEQEGVTYYRYQSRFPHAGAGCRVEF